MKNIHVLPTDKSSRLVKGETTGRLLLHNTYGTSTDRNKTQNIYITSDEEIKEGDYVYSISKDYNIQKVLKQFVKGYNEVENYQKIILTTDQNLIKDGVQAIDDEFLEWFVSVPFGEIKEVEVEDNREMSNEFIELDTMSYKIIIPKEEKTKCYCGHTTTCDCGPEEPKQECMITKIMQMDAEMAYDSLPKQDKIMERFISNAKQETLEEAFKFWSDRMSSYDKLDVLRFGAVWQQERSYSEEEVKEILIKCTWILTESKLKWFEQFKKK